MGRITLLFVLTITSLFNANAQDLKKSKYLILDNQVHNFGVVKQIDGVVNHTFKIKNTTNNNVIIYDVVPECSCTEPSWDEEPILPNQSSDIEVGFKADHYPGQFDKLITVYTSLDTFELKIMGKVIAKPLSDVEKEFPFHIGGIRFMKDVFSMNSVFDNKVKTKEFVIYNDSINPVSDLKFENVPDYIQVTIDENIATKEQSKIVITYDPMKLKDYGYVTDYVNIGVGDYSMEMPIMANVSPFVPNYTEKELLNAPELSFDSVEVIEMGTVKVNTVKSEIIIVRNSGKTDLKVMKIKPACKCIVSNISDSFVLKPNESKEVTLSFDSKGRAGKSKKSVYFYSNDPKAPARVIKVTGKVVE